MMLTVDDPLAEPMIHRDFPGGFEELQEYVMEVCEGIKDHCVRDPDDPDDTRWEYTYHQRLFGYDVPGLGADRPDRAGLPAAGRDALHPAGPGDHLEGLGGQHAATTRPACRASGAGSREDEGQSVLNMNVRFRSNDAYKAAFMNIFALVQLQRRIAAADRRAVRPADVAWAATATWPTATTSTAATWPSSRAVS